MTLSIMTNNILRYCPLNPDIISSVLQDSYKSLGRMEWNRLDVTRQFTTLAPYSTGTVTVDTNGNVSGVGTSFSSVMVGCQMRVFYSDSFFQIASVGGVTSLVLQDWSGLVISTPIPFTIFGLVYTLPTTLRLGFNIAYETSLGKKSQDFFNRRDPARTTTGTPTWWAFAGFNSGGYPLVEIYPISDQAYTLRCYGSLNTVPLLSSDTPLIPEDLIEAHALLNCFRIKQTMEPKGGWEARVTLQQSAYADILTTVRDEDYRLAAHRDKVKDFMDVNEDYPPSDTFYASHDVE